MDFIKNPRAIEEKSMDLINPFMSIWLKQV